ncbi:MAG: 1,4-dihydroxy-2-naphthoate octaprenyltransferase [Halothiobacillaceae bacterium]
MSYSTEALAHALTATRPGFLSVMALPVLLGSAMAWQAGHGFSVPAFLLAVGAAVLLHAFANVVNDLGDHHRGADRLNTTPLTPFAGGSRVIQRGVLDVGGMKRLAVVLLLSASVIGLVLAWMAGWSLLLLGLAGIVLGLAYSAGPWPLAYHGLGEPAVALVFGPMAVAGSYFTQTGDWAPAAWLAGLPVGLLVAAILLVNEFPDAPSDRLAGKRSWVVLFGARRAWWLLAFIMVLAFALWAVLCLAGVLPRPLLLVLLVAPLAWQAVLRTPADLVDNPRRLAGIRGVIRTHALFVSLAVMVLAAMALVATPG